MSLSEWYTMIAAVVLLASAAEQPLGDPDRVGGRHDRGYRPGGARPLKRGGMFAFVGFVIAGRCDFQPDACQ